MNTKFQFHKKEEKKEKERYLVTYTDLTVLLFAFMIILYAMSDITSTPSSIETKVQEQYGTDFVSVNVSKTNEDDQYFQKIANQEELHLQKMTNRKEDVYVFYQGNFQKEIVKTEKVERK